MKDEELFFCGFHQISFLSTVVAGKLTQSTINRKLVNRAFHLQSQNVNLNLNISTLIVKCWLC